MRVLLSRVVFVLIVILVLLVIVVCGVFFLSNVVGRILRERKRERILESYASRGRMVPKTAYSSIKRLKRCESCGQHINKVGRLEVHHKVSVRDGGSNERGNLLGLCRSCHKKAHKGVSDGD